MSDNNTETVDVLVKLLSESYDREKALNAEVKELNQRLEWLGFNLNSAEEEEKQKMRREGAGEEWLENLAFTFRNTKLISSSQKINLIKELRAITGFCLKNCKNMVEARLGELGISVEDRNE